MRFVHHLRLLGLFGSTVFGAPSFAQEPSVLDSCTDDSSKPGELSYSCRGFTAFVSIEQPTSFAEAGPESFLQAMKRTRQVDAHRENVVVSGVKRPGMRYSGDGTLGIFAMVPCSSPGRVRAVGCETQEPTGCEGVLDALAKRVSVRDPSKDVKPTTDAPVFVGRTLATPAGCVYKITGPQFVIACKSGILSWFVAGPEDPPGYDWAFDPFKKSLSAEGKVSERVRPCVLDGKKADCRDVRVDREGKPPLNATATMTEVRHQRVYVQCNVVSREGEALPTPCSLLLQFR